MPAAANGELSAKGVDSFCPDEIERLAALSHPRAVIDTAGLSPEHTELANRLARDIRRLDRDTVRQMIALLTGRGGRPG